jgi:hypothetical protein
MECETPRGWIDRLQLIHHVVHATVIRQVDNNCSIPVSSPKCSRIAL